MRGLGVALFGAAGGASLWALASAWTRAQSGAFSMLVAFAVFIALRSFSPRANSASATAAVAAFATALGCAVGFVLSLAAMFAVAHDVGVVRVFEALSVAYLIDTGGGLMAWYDGLFILGSIALAALGTNETGAVPTEAGPTEELE